MSPEYSLCPQSIVHVLRVQFMSPEYRLCSQSTVYDHRVRYFPQIEVNLLILLCISREHRLSSKVQFMDLDYTLCPNSQSIVYILRAQFSSTENSLCP